MFLTKLKIFLSTCCLTIVSIKYQKCLENFFTQHFQTLFCYSSTRRIIITPTSNKKTEFIIFPRKKFGTFDRNNSASYIETTSTIISLELSTLAYSLERMLIKALKALVKSSGLLNGLRCSTKLRGVFKIDEARLSLKL